MTKYYGKSEEVGLSIVQRFQAGTVAEPLKQVLLSGTEVPMNGWSFNNRFVLIITGHTDARGIKQWASVGRSIKGSKATGYIMVPYSRTFTKLVVTPETGREEEKKVTVITGYGTTPVWDVSVTSGEPLQTPEEHKRILEALPLMEVARAWGVDVKTISPANLGYLGYYANDRNEIAVGTVNVRTWLHELMHKADFVNGTKVEPPNHWRSEAVADLGACVLAHMLGLQEVDEGGAWEYNIKAQAKGDKLEAINICMQVIKRVGAVVDLILTTAEKQEAAVAA